MLNWIKVNHLNFRNGGLFNKDTLVDMSKEEFKPVKLGYKTVVEENWNYYFSQIHDDKICDELYLRTWWGIYYKELDKVEFSSSELKNKSNIKYNLKIVVFLESNLGELYSITWAISNLYNINWFINNIKNESLFIRFKDSEYKNYKFKTFTFSPTWKDFNLKNSNSDILELIENINNKYLEWLDRVEEDIKKNENISKKEEISNELHKDETPFCPIFDDEKNDFSEYDMNDEVIWNIDKKEYWDNYNILSIRVINWVEYSVYDWMIFSKEEFEKYEYHLDNVI